MKNKRFVKYLKEIAIMLLVVSLSFALFTVLLFKIFPLGITLTQVLERRNGQDSSGKGERAFGDMFGLDKKAGGVEQQAATLSEMGNEVRSKGASSIAWGPAQVGMKLSNHDAVQTFAQSSAQINFDRNNYITMGSNSLVIIKRIEKEAARDQRRSTIVVVDGQLQGHIASSGSNALQLNIATQSAAVKMQPGGAAKAEFKIAINPDQSSTVLVFKGEASVSAKGKTVRVRENSGLTVKPGEAPQDATPLPAPPAQGSPPEGSVVRYRDLPQRVLFKWGAAGAESRYHLQLARDRKFKEVVLDTTVANPEFAHGNLKKGIYFWRVSRIAGAIEGVMSKPLRLEVVQSLAPPQLQVTFPTGPVQEGTFVVTGSTAPGTRIFVAGKAVPTDATGGFSCELPVKPGMTLVTVEAVDASGNVTYKSSYVQGRF